MAGDEDVLSRPTASPAGFDWESLYGLYLKGKEEVRERAYVKAAERFESCLKQDTNYLPALVELASLANRRADPDAARGFARHALSIDTYDPGANYQFGLASAALGHARGCQGGFQSLRPHPGAGAPPQAPSWPRSSFASSSTTAPLPPPGKVSTAICGTWTPGRCAPVPSACRAMLPGRMPLWPHCSGSIPSTTSPALSATCAARCAARDVTALIRNELPHETFLELAAWYHGVGRDGDAAKVLDLAPPTAEVLYWLAWLHRDTNLLARAEAASPEFVFPFRTESIPVFEWAARQSSAWQPNYFLALIRWRLGESAEARRLLADCSDRPRFAPFYAARAQLAERDAVRDLRRAAELDPAQWRFGAMLARYYLKEEDAKSALAVATDFSRRFPDNSPLALLRAKSLLLTSQFQAAADLLASLHVLPAEGTTEARSLFHEAFLLLAVQRLQAGAADEALRLVGTARQWPETLGTGKPYAAAVDERLEDWVTAQCQFALKTPDAARQSLEKILAVPARTQGQGTRDLIRALALKQSGRIAEAEKLLENWQAQAPGTDLAKWGADLFAGRPAPLPPSLKDLDCRVLAGLARN